MNFFYKFKELNWSLVILMYALLYFGFSAIELAAENTALSGEWFSSRQKIWVLLGTFVFFITAFSHYRLITFIAFPLYFISIALLLILFFFGNKTHQITLLGFSFQPTQLAIASGILMNAVIIDDGGGNQFIFKKLLSLLVINSLPFFLVVLNNDIGSAIIWIPVFLCALLMSGLTIRYFVFIGILFFAIFPFLYQAFFPLAPRAKNRIDTYIERLITKEIKDKRGRGYAAHWISTAVGNGKWDGNKNKKSVHSLGLIPQDTAHNDYIFAVIAEKQGFRGASILILTYLAFLMISLGISIYSKDILGSALVTGIVTLFFAHIFENIGMCLLLTPMTGIPLPFISYSGTFVLICMFLAGILQSVWIHRDDLHTKKQKRSILF